MAPGDTGPEAGIGPELPPADYSDPDVLLDLLRWPGSEEVDGIDELNRHHAVVMVGNRVLVLRETINDEGRPDVRFLSTDDFERWLANVQVPEGRKMVSLAKHWLGSPRRRQYVGVAFAPAGAPKGYYNLWRGFAVEPRPGDCSLFREHLYENVCRGNATLFDWVWGWLAHLVQRPGEKVGTALALRGDQGVGKTKVGEVMGSIIGDGYLAVADPRFVSGRFNGHLAQCLLLHADEGFWAGDRIAESKLKDLITGSHHLVELKGKEPFRVRNLCRLMVTGNPDWLVPAGMDERRFAVLDVGTGRKGDHGFFAALDAQMDAAGREALLHELLGADLSGIDLRRVPHTDALQQQKVQSLGPEASWWLDRLHAGAVLEAHDDWQRTVPCAHMHREYVRHAELTGTRERASQTILGQRLRQLVPGVQTQRLTYAEANGSGSVQRRGNCYVLPPLGYCRRAFCERLGEVAWDD